jgi:hypothetical protein
MSFALFSSSVRAIFKAIWRTRIVIAIVLFREFLGNLRMTLQIKPNKPKLSWKHFSRGCSCRLFENILVIKKGDFWTRHVTCDQQRFKLGLDWFSFRAATLPLSFLEQILEVYEKSLCNQCLCLCRKSDFFFFFCSESCCECLLKLRHPIVVSMTQVNVCCSAYHNERCSLTCAMIQQISFLLSGSCWERRILV